VAHQVHDERFLHRQTQSKLCEAGVILLHPFLCAEVRGEGVSVKEGEVEGGREWFTRILSDLNKTHNLHQSQRCSIRVQAERSNPGRNPLKA